ncbi:Glutathione import ATP-binding protein GsiA [Ensifer psoraleae]|uniref:ABC transporter ATP-binding protein n=1 Tax=Sinorhizobium psoraleae TaxID=520838 RepID=UPI001AEEDDA2|nr:oligopeptide/dipeptide ABC transporter ATP-binding protein [Sinorhizobium psoraleae]NRP72165.1 Glutathione import ATP-binding protein GsiA [Sinorhizobium psoraleae]
MIAAPLVSVDKLKIHFPTKRRGRTVKAVDGVTFDIEPSTTLSIIGESGSGKSTLGRALVCLTRPTEGTVLHDGTDPFRLGRSALRRHRRDYQLIFQDPHAALDPRMTILESVREPLDIVGEIPKADRNAQAHGLLERVGIAPALHERYPHQLSGGQKQRVNIARALTTRPKVLVCDEVVAALDVSVQAGILNLFADIQRDFGLTYVFITHDLAVAAHISDEIAVMYLGQFVEKGLAEAVQETPLHPYTRALLSAEPEPLPSAMRENNRIVLKGEVPSPITPPAACRFHTRCPRAQARCSKDAPDFRQLRPGRWVACHFAEEMLEEAGEKAQAGPAERAGQRQACE